MQNGNTAKEEQKKQNKKEGKERLKEGKESRGNYLDIKVSYVI